MLIGAAVGLSSIMLYWGFGLISQSENDLGTGISETNSRIGEQFEVEDIYWNPDHSSIIIYIRNYGDPPIIIDRLIINGTDESSTISNLTVTSRDVGSLISSYSWSSSDVYTFLIGSNRGTYFEFEVTPP